MGCAGAVLRQAKFSVVTTIDHMQNFFECIKSRKDPNAPVETGVAAARAGQMVNLVYQRNGKRRLWI